ncbi:MAG: hypothetical protein LUH82_07615 [Clostridiales bacterium]|nr:hypothetical protein [Clostridiales bacterium]
MKKNRFYSNKKRNLKWTEEAQGRQIDFADKYAGGIYSDKFDYLRPKPKKKKKRISAETALKIARGCGAVIISIALIFMGYTVMDVYMLRHQMPALSQAESDSANIMETTIKAKGKYIESVSLDGGEMLDSTARLLADSGYSSAVFDIKRQDGTVAYQSGLSNIDAFSAISFAADDLAGSVRALTGSNILSIGLIYCYLDNIAPAKDTAMAVLNEDGTLYTDSAGNTYLSPDSDEAYNYIKDIIEECVDNGITVFALAGLELPDSAAGSESGSFETLSKRLYSDIGSGIKLLEVQSVSIEYGEDTDVSEIEEQVSELKDLSGEDKIYFIESEYADIKELLDENEILSYIISN